MSGERVERIVKHDRWFRRWEWDVWFRGPSGGGPFKRGTSWTRRGAERQITEATR